MKLLHTSDLHIGKRVNSFSMLEEQQYMLERIFAIAKEEQPDAIILAGDIYDKGVPPTEAVTLFDDFLWKLATLDKLVLLISGNHDSAERLAFGHRLLANNSVYVSPAYDGSVKPIAWKQDGLCVDFYLLPFVKPTTVQHYAPEGTELKSYDAAVRHAIGEMQVDASHVNVLLTHQYITDAERSDSEEVAIGGLDNVDAAAFESFDYVALGHLHRPQHCQRNTVRYSGSPLKYSFSEVDDQKSVTLVEIVGKGDVKVTERPLTPLHDWHDLRGCYDELVEKDFYDGTPYQEDFVRITLTDEEDIPDAMRRLQSIYHRLMELHYDNKRTRAGYTQIGEAEAPERRMPDEIFAELYEKQNGQPIGEEQKQYLQSVIGEVFSG